MFEVTIAPNPALERLIRQHPRVAGYTVREGAPLAWNQGDWYREVRVGDSSVEIKGLVELQDNNPLVCTDIASVPSPAATLALIAAGPIASAGLLVESPTMLTNAPADEDDVKAFLATAGWGEGVTIHSEPAEMGSVYAATVVCAIRTPEHLEDLDELYDERYGRSLYVQKDDPSEWDTRLVQDTPRGLYRLRISPDEPHSLFTIQVMADRNGKCGAAQIVHCFNVMCGFEESLGIS